MAPHASRELADYVCCTPKTDRTEIERILDISENDRRRAARGDGMTHG